MLLVSKNYTCLNASAWPPGKSLVKWFVGVRLVARKQERPLGLYFASFSFLNLSRRFLGGGFMEVVVRIDSATLCLEDGLCC
jgi:hypothetical protein